MRRTSVHRTLHLDRVNINLNITDESDPDVPANVGLWFSLPQLWKKMAICDGEAQLMKPTWIVTVFGHVSKLIDEGPPLLTHSYANEGVDEGNTWCMRPWQAEESFKTNQVATDKFENASLPETATAAKLQLHSLPKFRIECLDHTFPRMWTTQVSRHRHSGSWRAVVASMRLGCWHAHGKDRNHGLELGIHESLLSCSTTRTLWTRRC